MKAWLFLVTIVLAVLCPCVGRLLWSAPDRSSEPRPELHRSPCDLAILARGKLAVTANHTADSASLLDLDAGKILCEQPCGRKPAGVAAAPDGRRAAVSNLWSGTLTLLEVHEKELRPVGTAPVGSQPRGLVFAPDGASLYVALAGLGEVVQLEWDTRKVLRRWAAPGEPRRLALSRDGRFLAAASARAGKVHCWDTRTGKQLWEKSFVGAFNMHGLTFSPDDKELVTAHVYEHCRAINKRNIEEGWALNNRLGRLPLDPTGEAGGEQLALDIRGAAVADPCAVAFSEGKDQTALLAVAAGGTQELLLLKVAGLAWSSGQPRDFLDSALEIDPARFRRVPLGGRPLAVRFAGARAVVANYLLDAVQVVDVKAGKVERTIALGGPARPSLARVGESIFYDARRSHHRWFSCHTCHTDGHTCGRLFDTLNDESYGNPKLTPTLRGVTKTGPWTWHGWQDDLGKAVEKSLLETQFGPKPSAGDVQALVAFLGTLDHPPNPNRQPDGSLSEPARRGQGLFQGKARCARCHQGEQFTSTKNYDVKIEDDGSPFELWNPPSLRGVYDRGPYMHDGRADTLDEVLRSPHAPEKLGGEKLTPEERRDLIEFLKAL
jgi:cytochrome c peroxidase